jgi:branched-chain amino acid transport system ATP-binding protein
MAPLLLEHVTKRFGGVEAVAELSLEFARGRVTGLIGPNGAGKTTVVNLITGMTHATSGRIVLGAEDLTHATPEKCARAGIARTFQNIRLLREASVLDNIVIGCHRHERTSLLANLLGLPAVWHERAAFRARARALLQRFGMTEYVDLPAGALSYGHQRRVEMMRALAMAPDYLLLDEPVAGMTDGEATEIGAIVTEIARDGVGVLLIEHNMRFVMEMCDQVYVVNSGRLIAAGPVAAICADPAVIDAYLGS